MTIKETVDELTAGQAEFKTRIALMIQSQAQIAIVHYMSNDILKIVIKDKEK